MQWIAKIALAAAGIIHLLPLSGVLGAFHLERLYGMKMTDPNMLILMQHRAVLFGLLGAFLIYAAFAQGLFWIAWTGGLISIAAFLLIALATGSYNAGVARVVLVDWIALALLVVGALAQLTATRL